jgi:HEPN domain-containing protein
LSVDQRGFRGEWLSSKRAEAALHIEQAAEKLLKAILTTESIRRRDALNTIKDVSKVGLAEVTSLASEIQDWFRERR